MLGRKNRQSPLATFAAMPKLHSMTGFGKATLELPAKKITFEIKSLNSKQMDVNIRLPLIFKEKETLMRKMISEKLQRGKVDLTMNCEITGSELAPKSEHSFGEVLHSSIARNHE